MQGFDIDIALELLLQGFVHAFDPELHLAVAIEGAGGLDTELVDGAVGDGVVVALAAGDALHIEHDEALGGEHPLVAEDAESSDNLFAGGEDGAKLALELVDIDLGGIAKKMIQNRHGTVSLNGYVFRVGRHQPCLPMQSYEINLNYPYMVFNV